MTWIFIGYVDGNLSVSLGDKAGDTSGTPCSIESDLDDGIPRTLTFSDTSSRCLGRFLTLKPMLREPFSLCLVKIFGFCPG